MSQSKTVKENRYPIILTVTIILLVAVLLRHFYLEQRHIITNGI